MLLGAGEYVVMVAVIACVAAVTLPSSFPSALESIAWFRNGLYEALTSTLVLQGSSHAKPLDEIEGGQAPVGLLVAFTFAYGASLMTSIQVLGHLLHYTSPIRQRYVIRILLMVPIYAIDSFWSYLSFQDATWISIARDTYEAYVLYNFFALLMDLLGGVDGCVALWKKNGQTTMAHSFPMNYILPDMKLTADVLWWWKILLVQYMVLSPLITMATFVSGLEGVFDENSYSLEDAHVYLMVAKLVSVTLAFTALFYLYLATKVIIHDYDPTGKFISIKFVIFFSFWQYLGITTAQSMGVFPQGILESVLSWSHGASSLEDQEVALCNLLMCAEMFITAIMHHFVFAVESLEGDGHNNKSSSAAPLGFSKAVEHAFSISDVVETSVQSAKEAHAKSKNEKKTQ